VPTPTLPLPVTGKRKTRVAASVSEASLAADASCSSSGARTPAPTSAPRAPAKLCVFEVCLAAADASAPVPTVPEGLQQHSCTELPLKDLWTAQHPQAALAVAPQHARLYRLLCRALRERSVREWARCSAARAAMAAEPRNASPPDAMAMRVDEEREEGEEGEADAPASPLAPERSASTFLPLSHGLMQVPHLRSGSETSPFAAKPACTFAQMRIALTPDALHLSMLLSNCTLSPFGASPPARRMPVLLSPSGLSASFVMLHSMPSAEQAAPLRETLSHQGIALPSACSWALCARADPAGGEEHLFLYPTPLLLLDNAASQQRPAAALSAPRSAPAMPLRGLELATRAATELAMDAAALLREAGAPLLQMPVLPPAPVLKEPPAARREGIALPERTRPAPPAEPEKPPAPAPGTAGKDEDMAAAPALELTSEAPAEEDTSAGEDLWGDGSGDEDAAEVKMDDPPDDASEEDDVPLAVLRKTTDASKPAGETDSAAPGEVRPEDVELPASPHARETHATSNGSAMSLLDSSMQLSAFPSPAAYEAPAARREARDDDAMSGLDDFGLTEDDFSFFDDGAAFAAPQADALAPAAAAVEQTVVPAVESDKEAPDEVFSMDLDAAGDVTQMEESPHAEAVWAGATPGPPTAPSGSSSEMISHSSTSASVGSIGGGSAMDPPSLPGFTPSSFFSASSPAFGGLLGKTPLTPFSPADGDQHIGIVGADGQYGPPVRFGEVPQERRDEESDAAGLLGTSGASVSPQKKGSAAMEALSQQQRLRDMSNKYQGGRFAPHPRHPSTVGSPDRQTGVARRPSLGRTLSLRAAQRRNENVAVTATDWRPPPLSPDEGKVRKRIGSRGNGYTALSMPALHKLRLLDRAEEKEAMSEQDDASDEGSEDGADEDESSAEESAAEEEQQQEEMLERRTDRLLLAASDLLAALEMGAAAVQQVDAAPALELPSEVRSPNESADSDDSDDEDEMIATSSPAELEDERDRRWNILVNWLVSNPQMRHTASHGPGRRGTPSLAQLVPALHCAAAVRGLEALTGTPASLAALLAAPAAEEVKDSSSADTSAASTPSSGARLEVLEAPDLLVGCQGSVTRVAPTALRFWDKLGLSAAGGPRRVTAFALHIESAPASQATEVARWLARLEKTFQVRARAYDLHVPSLTHLPFRRSGWARTRPVLTTCSRSLAKWASRSRSTTSRAMPVSRSELVRLE
jgi:hypothetical protein